MATAPQSYLAAFVQGLHQLGWTDGQNIRVDIRWNAGDAALARIYAAQLIGLTPDVILASSTTNLTVIQQATNTIPVVFVSVSDPVAQGFIASVTKPGGNLTGFSMYESTRLAGNGSTCSKRLHLPWRASQSYSTPTCRPSPNSSCDPSRLLRKP
jgi:ABC transporter substrate binding protein